MIFVKATLKGFCEFYIVIDLLYCKVECCAFRSRQVTPPRVIDHRSSTRQVILRPSRPVIDEPKVPDRSSRSGSRGRKVERSSHGLEIRRPSPRKGTCRLLDFRFQPRADGTKLEGATADRSRIGGQALGRSSGPTEKR